MVIPGVHTDGVFPVGARPQQQPRNLPLPIA